MKRTKLNKTAVVQITLGGVFFFFWVLVSFDAVAAQKKLGDTLTVLGANDHPHNFSEQASSPIHSAPGTETRMCVFCHTPHNSSSSGALWNRNDPIGPNGDGTFPLYGQLTDLWIDDIPGLSEYDTTDYPNGASRLCLSCHDGVTAIGEVIDPGQAAVPLGGLGSIESISGASDPAIIDLTRSHPISFVYSDAVRLSILGNKQVGGSGIPAGSYTNPAAGILDANERMQCTACHDPHTDTREAVGYDLPMWRKWTGNEANDYEDTCIECHGASGSSSPGLNTTPSVGGNHNL